VAVLRIVLTEVHHVLPDLLVEKRIDEGDWRERYDAVLLTGDGALREATSARTNGLTRYNVTEMWRALTRAPLVHAVWVYDDASRSAEITRALDESRRLGLDNLPTLAEEAACATGLDATAVYDYLTRAWSYDLGEGELEGLRALDEFARKYDLIRESRLAAPVKA
jgi:predicted solute-binding protein